MKKLKIVLIGDGGTGKTNFVESLKGTEFNSEYTATMGFEISQLKIPSSSGDGNFELEIWDTAGQEKTGSLRDSYYQDAAGAILFFDVTARTTYKSIPNWHRDIKRVCGEVRRL